MRLENVDIDALTARRHRALDQPLQAGDSLAPSRPSLDSSAITPAPNDPLSPHEQNIASQSPNPYRPPISRLRNVVSRNSLPSSLRFDLVQARSTGEDAWSQVWTAQAREGQEGVGTVVVKLFVEALFPREASSGFWRSADDSVACELASYKAFRAVQGRDVPHLYGAFSFVMPWGETVVGIVLEDLCEASVSLHDYCEDNKADLQTVDAVDALYTAAYGLLERLHNLGRTAFQPDTHDIRILSSSSSSNLHLVWIDFSRTIAVEAHRVKHDKRVARLAALGVDVGPWHHHEATRVEKLFDYFFPGTRAAWGLRELVEGRGGPYVRLLQGET